MPEYARGKSAHEVLGITQKLVDAGFASFRQPQAPVPQAPPQAQPFTLDPEGYVTGSQFQQAQRQAFEQYVQPDITAGIELAASANFGLTRNKHDKEFAKYGPEIMSRLAGVPKKMWTLDNLDTVVKLVKADHLDDYRAEWQTEVRASMEPTIRSSGAGGSVPVTQENKEHSLESEKIPDEWKRRAQKAGITESTVREFCAKNDMTPEAFYKQFETPTNQIVAEVQDAR